MTAFTTTRILHGYRFVGAPHIAALIRTLPKTCHTQSYLDCVTMYNEAVYLCAQFADASRDPALRDIDVFMDAFRTFEENDAEPESTDGASP